MPETAPGPSDRATANASGLAAPVQEARLPVLAGERPGDPVSRALAAWLRSLEAGSPRTVLAYRRDAESFAAFLAQSYGPGLDSLLRAQPSDVAAFISHNLQLSDATRARRATVLRSLFAALVRDGLRPTNPAAEIRVRKSKSGNHHRAVPQGIVEDAMRRLVGSQDPQDIRDRALLLLIFNVAARRAEIASLNVGSLERSPNGTGHVAFIGKGKRAARMSVYASVMQAIDAWLAVGGHASNPDAPLFHCLSNRPDHRGRRLTGAGIACIVKRHFPNASPHCLRAHSITFSWQRSGKDLLAASTFARHSGVNITAAVYVQPENESWAQAFAPDYGLLV